MQIGWRHTRAGNSSGTANTVSSGVKFVQNGRFEIHIGEAIKMAARWFCATSELGNVIWSECGNHKGNKRKERRKTSL
jgi:hypothetical protein